VFEVELGKLAAQKSTNARVKNFANMLVTDHTGVNGEVKTIANNKNITIPGSLDSDQQKEYDDFSKKTGDFDKDYIRKMEDSHEKGINRFEKASKSDDSEIAAFANKILPALRMHLDSARAIRKDL
jgi:putative membrane protein